MGSICSRGSNKLFHGSELMLPLRSRSKRNEDTSIVIVAFILIIQSFAPPTRAFMGAKYICDKIPNLSPRQRHVCYSNPTATVIADEGSYMGQEECRRQFKHWRWNCKSDNEAGDETLGTKEAAYHSAIRAAGVLHAVASACGEGEISNCGCDTSKRGPLRHSDFTKWHVESRATHPRGTTSNWHWGGCSVDIRQANRLCKEVWDARETTRSVRARLNLHNYEAGRKTLMKRMKIQCICHGPSGSCTMRTCWVTLPDFREVGGALRNAYSKSKKVKNIFERRNKNQYPSLAYIENGIPKKPMKRELIYTDSSPSYCVSNSTTRTNGTEGRICRSVSSDTDNCSYLCCGRGYDVQRKLRKWDCKCKFYWCCHVECEECHEPSKQYVCR